MMTLKDRCRQLTRKRNKLSLSEVVALREQVAAELPRIGQLQEDYLEIVKRNAALTETLLHYMVQRELTRDFKFSNGCYVRMSTMERIIRAIVPSFVYERAY